MFHVKKNMFHAENSFKKILLIIFLRINSMNRGQEAKDEKNY